MAIEPPTGHSGREVFIRNLRVSRAVPLILAEIQKATKDELILQLGRELYAHFNQQNPGMMSFKFEWVEVIGVRENDYRADFDSDMAPEDRSVEIKFRAGGYGLSGADNDPPYRHPG